MDQTTAAERKEVSEDYSYPVVEVVEVPETQPDVPDWLCRIAREAEAEAPNLEQVRSGGPVYIVGAQTSRMWTIQLVVYQCATSEAYALQRCS